MKRSGKFYEKENIYDKCADIDGNIAYKYDNRNVFSGVYVEQNWCRGNRSLPTGYGCIFFRSDFFYDRYKPYSDSLGDRFYC